MHLSYVLPVFFSRLFISASATSAAASSWSLPRSRKPASDEDRFFAVVAVAVIVSKSSTGGLKVAILAVWYLSAKT
jgi:hypothetical protein